MELLKISLAAARVNAGMTQQEAAERLGVTRNTIITWESGRRNPGFMEITAIAHVYGIPVDNIFLPTELAES